MRNNLRHKKQEEHCCTFRLSKKMRSPLGPLCEGAPPAGGGGENCAIARNISGNGKALSLRPYGATAPLLALRAISPVPGESVSQREVFRHAAGKHSAPQPP